MTRREITNEWLGGLNWPQGFSQCWNHLSNFANRKLTMAFYLQNSSLLPMYGVDTTISSIQVTCLVPVASVFVSDAWSTLFCTVVCVMAYWKCRLLFRVALRPAEGTPALQLHVHKALSSACLSSISRVCNLVCHYACAIFTYYVPVYWAPGRRG